MKPHKKQWNIRTADPVASQLAEQLGISPVLTQVLVNRGLTCAGSVQSFLNPRLTELIEPEKMPGAEAAVAVIRRAVAAGEQIAIYGDYDVDGITGVAILWRLLKLLGARVEYYIPHRIDEGYGLNAEAVRQLADGGARLIITVDCGITAVDQAALGRELGVEMIITDHHRPKDQLPKAAVIVHPSIDKSYPNGDSAGAMVAFKLAWAVINAVNNGSRTAGPLREFLLDATTLAAVGTIADVVDLRGENRVLTSFGLKALQDSGLPGICALVETAELTGTVDSYDIGFRLAPMLNAAGRMGHARLAVELLTSDSEIRCMQIARYLKDQNRLRQQCQRKIFKEAKTMITAMGLNHPDRKTIVLASENWHTGVVGIVASRIIDEFMRPAIMINTGGDNGFGQGSARSVEGFNIHDAISACSGYLESFGGHAMAAGLKIRTDKIADFAEAIEQYAQEHLRRELLISRLDIDAVCSMAEMDDGVVRQLNMLEPFGQGNPPPVFATRGVRWMSPPRTVGSRADHLQMAITDGTASVRCIGFNMGRYEKKLLDTDFFSIAYRPQFNTFRGVTTVQFVIVDIQFE